MNGNARPRYAGQHRQRCRPPDGGRRYYRFSSRQKKRPVSWVCLTTLRFRTMPKSRPIARLSQPLPGRGACRVAAGHAPVGTRTAPAARPFNPYLTGSVLDGTAGEHSRIDILLFADSAKESKSSCSIAASMSNTPIRAKQVEAVLVMETDTVDANLVIMPPHLGRVRSSIVMAGHAAHPCRSLGPYRNKLDKMLRFAANLQL